jgi:hypothetical protein
MAIPANFDSATGALTGDHLDNTIATGRDAARPTPNLRGDPDAGGQIQSAVHQPTPSLRGDPDDGGQIQSAVHRPTPSLRDDPDAGGQIQSAVHRPTPSLRDDPDAGGQIQGVVHRPTPSLRDDPDAGGIQSTVHRPTPSLGSDPDSGGQIQSAMQRPTPSLWDDPDAGGQIQSVVQQFAGGQHTFTAPDMAGASDQLVMLGATSRLVQAMASFSAAGAADTSNTLPLGAETSQPSFLTTPQHA